MEALCKLSKRLDTIHKILEKLNQPDFRFLQICDSIFKKKIKEYKAISSIPSELKKELISSLGQTTLMFHAKTVQDSKQVTKVLFGLHDNNSIESVYMRFLNGKASLCISSQVGCALKCNFCATGAIGFKRQLTADEIVDQVLYFQQIGKQIDSVSFMGMGEPLQNPKVFLALDMLTNRDLFAMRQRRISVSTVGIIPGIERLTRDFPQINLAFSLHSPFDEQRNILVPTNKIYPLSNVMKCLEQHTMKTKRKVFLAYLMLDGYNDTIEHANGIISLIKHLDSSVQHLFHVNLLRYNPAEGIGEKYQKTSEQNLKRFMNMLTSNGNLSVTARRSFGTDIDAACGQLFQISEKLIRTYNTTRTIEKISFPSLNNGDIQNTVI